MVKARKPEDGLIVSCFPVRDGHDKLGVVNPVNYACTLSGTFHKSVLISEFISRNNDTGPANKGYWCRYEKYTGKTSAKQCSN